MNSSDAILQTPTALAFRAIEIANGAPKHLRVVRRQLFFATTTAGGAFLAFTATLLYVLWGPPLEGDAVAFAALLLISFGSLFLFSLAVLAVTAVSAFVAQHLQLVEAQIEIADATEETELTHEILSLLREGRTEEALRKVNALPV